jgi:hypothetical protein
MKTSIQAPYGKIPTPTAHSTSPHRYTAVAHDGWCRWFARHCCDLQRLRPGPDGPHAAGRERISAPLEAPRSIAVVRPGEGELLRAGPVVHRVLEDGGVTAGRLGVVECRMPAG